MAPEVFKHRKYDKKVDVFSFAMILYEVIVVLFSIKIQKVYSKQVVIHYILLCRCLKGSRPFQILSLMKQPSMWQKDTGQHFVLKDLISLTSESK